MVGGQSIDIGFEVGFPKIDTEDNDGEQQARRDQNLNTLTKLIVSEQVPSLNSLSFWVRPSLA